MREGDLARQIEAYLRNLPPSDAEAEVDGTAVLRAIEAQHSILVERARGIHSFAHLTFHEYYTARYVADNEARGSVKRLIDSHFTDDRWHVVFVLTASMLDNANRFFERFAGALDALARRGPSLAALLSSVDEHVAQEGREVLDPAATRSLVLYSALTHSFDLAQLPGFDSMLDSDCTRALEVDLDLDHNLARVLIRDLTRVLGLDIGLARARVRDLTRVRDLARGLTRVLGLDLGLARDQTGLQLLLDYLDACRLYVECLDVAYVSDRAALRDRLLRAPGGQDTTAN